MNNLTWNHFDWNAGSDFWFERRKNGKHFCHLLSAAETELTDGGSWGANGGGGGFFRISSGWIDLMSSRSVKRWSDEGFRNWSGDFASFFFHWKCEGALSAASWQPSKCNGRADGDCLIESWLHRSPSKMFQAPLDVMIENSTLRLAEIKVPFLSSASEKCQFYPSISGWLRLVVRPTQGNSGDVTWAVREKRPPLADLWRQISRQSREQRNGLCKNACLQVE